MAQTDNQLTKANLLAAVGVLMREAERLNDEASLADVALFFDDVRPSRIDPVRQQAAENIAQSCRLAAVAGALQAQANAMVTAIMAQPVTHDNEQRHDV